MPRFRQAFFFRFSGVTCNSACQVSFLSHPGLDSARRRPPQLMTYSVLLSSKHLQNFMEIVGAACILLAFLAPRFGCEFFAAIERRFARIARSPRIAVASAAAFPLAARLAMLGIFPFPSPAVHDEFSYLLSGDTFAHARAANPVPPEWQHFETEYVLLRPTYASQYQPGQGLFLAAGQSVAGHPWWGVWLSMGLMFAAICWGLREALPPRWAMFGAVIAAAQFGIYSFWMNSYFGGGVAAIGSALVFGSLLRMRGRPGPWGAACAFGLIVLFASRPFEAILWTIAAAAWCFRARRDLRPTAVIGPFAFVFLTGAGLLA